MLESVEMRTLYRESRALKVISLAKREELNKLENRKESGWEWKEIMVKVGWCGLFTVCAF